MYDYYKKLLMKDKIPEFLNKYLECPSLLRLKKVGYFCGMDYASKDIYDFKEFISRFDHSLDVALLTWKFTKDEKATLAGLFHDIATPCFSHVVDYMNKDYQNQESTEELTDVVIKNDKYLLECLREDSIDVNDVIDFKKYSIVDNDRPKLCADRLDGVILTGLFWTKDLNKKDVNKILSHLTTYNNDQNELELGFDNYDVAKKVLEVSERIDEYCHSNEDNFMMELLAKMTKFAISNNTINYEDLYVYDEEKIHKIFRSIKNTDFIKDYFLFKYISKDEIPSLEMPYVKKRELKPLVNCQRLYKL